MAYGVIVRSPAPKEMYDAVGSEVDAQFGAGATPPGLLVHVARETDTGFEVIEVWESKADSDRFNDEVLAPLIDRISGGQAPERGAISEEFEVLGLRVGQSAARASS